MERNLEIPEKIRRFTDNTMARLAAMNLSDFVNEELMEPAGYLLKNRGKLLRPALVFLGADYIEAEDIDAYTGIAEAVELLHASSLVHDDIIDKDMVRRGKPSTNAKYGNEAAILAGNALISRAIQSASPYGSEVVEAISKTAMKMCAGEMLDFKYQNMDGVPEIEDYINAAGLKSSSLIGTSTSIAAVYNHNKKSSELYDFGFLLGTAFQIRDDIIDFSGESMSGRRRLNIVNCIMENNGIKEEDAMLKAAEMNVRYVEDAISRLSDKANSRLFVEYAEKVAVRKNEIESLAVEKE
jgi:geranylgeranyl pyrophosphate synthase